MSLFLAAHGIGTVFIRIPEPGFLNNLGAAYREAGRFDEALESYSAANDIVENIKKIVG